MNENMTKGQHTNPFFEPYNTPHDTVPFNNISLEDFEEAFMEGIRRDNEQIEKNINNPDKPTFDNTIINVDDDKDGYYDLLSRVSTVFFNLLSAETNDDMDALAQKIQPILTQHANDIRLNKRLFERIKAVHRHHRKLTNEEKMLLDNCYDGFVRSGALLDEDGKERLRKLTEEASMLSLQFSQNLLKENKAYTLHITDEKQLDGLPETAREAAATTAHEKGVEGWVFTLDYPSYSPFMTYANVVYSYGLERFAAAAAEAGVDGLILPDVPFEEKEEFAVPCRKAGIELISLIAPTSHERIAMIAREAEGFVYCVSSLGVTGVRGAITTDVGAMVRLVKKEKNIPCAVGFGISTPEQAASMRRWPRSPTAR